MSTDRMPTVYLGHGAPLLVDDPIWPGELAAWAAALPRPKAILVISAHWENAPLTIGATTPVPLVYDFSGFGEVLPRHVPRAGRARARAARAGARRRADAGRRAAHARPRPRRLRAAHGHVSAGGRPRAADLDAQLEREAAPHARPAARAAT